MNTKIYDKKTTEELWGGANGAIETSEATYLTICRTLPTGSLWANNAEFLVRMDMYTGQVEFGPNYTIDEASRTFWLSMGKKLKEEFR